MEGQIPGLQGQWICNTSHHFWLTCPQLGKKKIKAIAKALRNVNGTPIVPGRQRPTNLLSTATFQAPIRNRTNSDTLQVETRHLGPTPISTPATTPGIDGRDSRQTEYDYSSPDGGTQTRFSTTTSPMPIKDTSATQGSARDSSTAWDSAAITSYGSIIPSPPAHNPPFRPPSLELPDPALPPEEEPFARHNRAWRRSHINPHITPPFRQRINQAAHPYEIGTTHVPPKATSSLLPRHRPLFKNRRAASNPGGPVGSDRPRLLRRIFSSAAVESPQIGDVPLAGYKELDIRQAEFEKYLDLELNKIESFYKMKEQEAGDRLIVLRRQLHEMRDRRVEEVRHLQQTAERQKLEQRRLHEEGHPQRTANALVEAGKSSIPTLDWRHPLDSVIGAKQHLGKNTKAFVSMGPAEHRHRAASSHHQTDQQDFTRKPTYTDDIPYRSAKRKLRMALQEFYRGLELLKSYALLNRTAFRKINKKYDKVVKARPTGRFMSEKVNKAWFVQSEVLEGQLVAIEDLYARYFEHGNHKIAVGKLRSKHSRVGDYAGSVFRNGLLLAAGAVFGVQGLGYGAEHLKDSDPTARTNASYLLQVRLTPSSS